MDFLSEQPPLRLLGGAVLVFLIIQSFLTSPNKKEAPEVVQQPSSTAPAKKKKKKPKKKAAAKPKEEEPKKEAVKAKEPPKVEEKQPEEPAAASNNTKKKNKKKKNKNKKPEPAPAPAPAPPQASKDVPAEASEDEDDDEDDDVARLLNANQLSKTTKKKKKKKKKKGSADSADKSNEEKEEENWVMVNKNNASSATSAPVPAPTETTPKEDAVHTVTLNLEASDKPVLVGPKGATIQNIQNTSNARLDIDLPVLKISGTESSIALAMEMVQNLLSEHKAKSAFTSTLEGTAIKGSEGVKAIIGKGGANIQKIQSTTGCKLDANIDAGLVKITGPSQEQVQQAATLCRHAIFGEHQDTIDLGDKSKVMLVLGQNFMKIRQFQDESGGAKLDIAKNTTLLKISGPTAAVQKAKQLVNDWLEQCRGIIIEIPKNTAPGSFDKVGAIYGKGGATIRAIQEKTGAFIHVDDAAGKCHVSGTPPAVSQATQMVKQAMEDGCLMGEGDVRETITLPKKAGPSVIGRGGSNIKLLEKTHDAKVRVSGSVCIIIGKPAAVKSCKAQVTESIEPYIEEERIQQEADRLAAEQEAAAASSAASDGVGAWSASLADDSADGW